MAESHSSTSWKEIPLTQGQFAIVDAEDYERLMRFKWAAHWEPKIRSYIAVSSKSKKMSRVVMGIDDPKIHVDHISHNTLDNRKENLRLANHAQNQWNKGLKSTNKSGYTGVSWDKSKNKWRATIQANKKWKQLGRFDNMIDAVEAYQRAAKKLFGSFKYEPAAGQSIYHQPEAQARQACGVL